MDREKVIDQMLYITVLLLALSSCISYAVSSVTMAAGILLLFWRNGWKIVNQKIDQGFLVAIGLFLSSVLLSCLFSPNLTLSLSKYSGVVERFLPMAVAIGCITTRQRLFAVILCISMSLVLSDGYALWQWFYEDVYRVSAWAGHPIVLATFILEIVPLMLVAGFCRSFGKFYSRWALLGGAALSFYILVINATRGAWIAALVMVVIWLGLRFRQNPRLCAGALVGLLVVGLTFVSVPSLQKRALSVTDMNQQSNSERIIMWQSAWDMFLDHPLTGVGLGRYKEMAMGQYASPLAREPENRGHSHSNIMNFLGETGILGFGGFCYFFIYSLNYYYRKYMQDKDDGWSLAAFLIITGFLIQGFTEFNFGHLLVMRLLTFIIGITLVAPDIMDSGQHIVEK